MAKQHSRAPAAGAAPSPGAELVALQDGEPSVDTLIAEELGILPESLDSDTDDEPADAGEESAESEENDDPASAGEDDETEAEEESESEEETTEEDPEEGESEEESAEEEPGEDDPAAAGKEPPPGVQKRIDELTREKYALKQQLAEKEAALAKATATPPRAPTGVEAEVEAATEPAEIEALEEKYQNLVDWATAHAQGVEIPPARPGDEPQVVSAEQMQQTLINARRGLRLLPKRAAAVQQIAERRTQFETYAHKEWPEYEDPDSPLSQTYAGVLRAIPELKRLPNAKVIVADAIAGQKLREAKLKQAKDGRPGKPAAKPVAKAPPPVAGAPARKPAPLSAASSKKKRYEAAMKRAETTGSEEDIAAAIEADL